MKIGVLTSSRADYGIYKPLLDELKIDSFFSLEIISFGSHLSKKFGYTISDIIADNYRTIHQVCELIDDDSPKSIAESYALTIFKFSKFWSENKYDIVISLGDRYEMSAAVQASIPFNIDLLHIHGGETTLGAIDNIYRHQITLASKFHFVTNVLHKKKVIELLGNDNKIYNIGSLSLNNIKSFKPISKSILFKKFKIKDSPFILVTFHPETVTINKNLEYAIEMKKALEHISKHINIVITMPNADTLGSIFRKHLLQLKDENSSNIFIVENFGKKFYFTAMYYSTLLIGNTSSGIIEAASFGKYVLNVGNRQRGRLQSKNTFNTIFKSVDIINKTLELLKIGIYKGKNIYEKEDSVTNFKKILKNEIL